MPQRSRQDNAALVAQQLATKFLHSGNYVFSDPLSPNTLADVMPAASDFRKLDSYFEVTGFSGLAVQSVGYEQGADNPKVHVYLTKGPRKREMEFQQDGVTIEINRVGKVIIRPETASSATNRGNVFERNGRVACGSSCAPSGKPYAGTLGALVRKRSNRDLYVLSNNHVLAAGNHVPVGMPILSPSSIDAHPGVRAPREFAAPSVLRSVNPSSRSLRREIISSFMAMLSYTVQTMKARVVE